MSAITRFSVRSSGRDLNAVRRPTRAGIASVVAAPVAAAVVIDPEDLNKADLANLAAASGVDPAGTKAEVLKRVRKSDD